VYEYHGLGVLVLTRNPLQVIAASLIRSKLASAQLAQFSIVLARGLTDCFVISLGVSAATLLLVRKIIFMASHLLPTPPKMR
jgi:hypothetical protein